MNKQLEYEFYCSLLSEFIKAFNEGNVDEEGFTKACLIKDNADLFKFLNEGLQELAKGNEPFLHILYG